MVEGTGREHMAQLIEKMSHDDRVDLLRRLTPRVAREPAAAGGRGRPPGHRHAGQYAENTAGALMTTDYAWLPANITAAEALDRLRLQAPDSETIYYIYVLDDQRRLLGVVSLRDLILAPAARIDPRHHGRATSSRVKATDDREAGRPGDGPVRLARHAGGR